MTNSQWTNSIPLDVYMRLCDCQTTKEDLPILVKAKWSHTDKEPTHGAFKGPYTKEDALIDILEMLDCNGLDNVTELTQEEWEELVK